MPEWKFRPMSDAEKSNNSTEGEFFRGDAVSAVVRESVQNSLDALDDKQGRRVRIRFYLSGETNALPAESGSRWLGALDEQISLTKRLPNALNGRTSIPFLAIEDFGTKGLIGDPTKAWHAEDALEANDFYFFWRALGTTGKRRSARGSWGVGKSTYQQVSAIKTFFGLTVRSDDEKQLLMGEARLGVRSLGDTRYDQFCSFGEFTSKKDPFFVTPVDSTSSINQFRSDFHLERRDEPGFSCVVPLAIVEELSDEAAAELADEFVLASIHHFALPILAGELRIEVVCPSQNTVLDDGHSIRDALARINLLKSPRTGQKHDYADLLASVELTEWALGKDANDQTVNLVNEAPTKACQWPKIVVPESQMGTLKGKFESSDPIAVSVPVTVRHKQEGDIDTSFKVYLRQCEGLKKSSVRFVRNGLTISDVRSPNLGSVAALVVVGEGSLAELLRSAENPAHTTWKREDRLGDRLNHDFTGGESRIGLVVDAPKVLVTRLLESGGKVDYDLLSEFFPIPNLDGFVRRKEKGRKDGKHKHPIPPDVPKIRKPLIFTELTDGFSLTRDRDVPLKHNKFQVLIAFDTASGDPFKAWEKFDFEIGRGGIHCDCAGGSKTIEGNKIIATIRDDSFRLVVRGFPPERDLAVGTPRWLPAKVGQTHSDSED